MLFHDLSIANVDICLLLLCLDEDWSPCYTINHFHYLKICRLLGCFLNLEEPLCTWILPDNDYECNCTDPQRVDLSYSYDHLHWQSCCFVNNHSDAPPPCALSHGHYWIGRHNARRLSTGVVIDLFVRCSGIFVWILIDTLDMVNNYK